MTQNFAKFLIKWYSLYSRKLPWRNSGDPYKIWLSEVILQQTRVDQGLAYYNSFVEHYPSIHELSNAHIDEVMKLWQGLGYYSRARNLYAGAQQIVREFNGVFPADYKSIRSIKGIGDYTAGAIASIAFNLPYPAIDGNVLRVITRIASISTPVDTTAGKSEIHNFLMEIIDKNQAGTFNQALMELGATICKPKSPLCNECPVNEFCIAFIENTHQNFPVKRTKLKPKNRYFLYLIPTFMIGDEKNTLMGKRSGKDIWFNLYDFPLIEASKEEDLSNSQLPEILQNTFTNPDFTVLKISGLIKHQLSHQTIYTRFLHLDFASLPKFVVPNDYRYIPLNMIHELAIPRLIDRYLSGKNVLIY